MGDQVIHLESARVDHLCRILPFIERHLCVIGIPHACDIDFFSQDAAVILKL